MKKLTSFLSVSRADDSIMVDSLELLYLILEQERLRDEALEAWNCFLSKYKV